MPKVVKSEDPLHIENAGFTQQEIADRLFLTIRALENYYVNTISTMEEDLLEKWWLLCRASVSTKIFNDFRLFTLRRFQFYDCVFFLVTSDHEKWRTSVAAGLV